MTYFDEVKSDNNAGRHEYIVAGLVIGMEHIGSIEKSMNELATELFGTSDLTVDTELHTQHIYSAKGNFKGRTMAERVEVIAKLAHFIGDNEYVAKVYAAIDTSKIYNKSQAPQFAFAHFVERVQMCVLKKPTILIGDLDDEQARFMVRDFSKYRTKGTPWAHGINIDTIVDSVHFCRSHHSRLIQLADAYAWLTCHKLGKRTGKIAEMVTEAIKTTNLFPNRYKYWPQ
ncbi:DUF3800 domain-containing protein [Bradyrhizobium oligotrophicum]